MTVQRQSVPVVTTLPGRVAPFLSADVRARVNGIVLKRLFAEGSNVGEGQLLYKIDPAPYQAALDSAKASLQKADANLRATRAQAARYKTLVQAHAISRQDYDNAVSAEGQAAADVASGQAAVESAKIDLGYTDVTSPIGGRIGISQVTVGAYVQASAATLLATVQQIDPVYVDLTESTTDLLRLRREAAAGQLEMADPDHVKVSLILEDNSQYPLPGEFKFSDITVNQGTGTVTVRAVFPNPKNMLLPGMFVHARLQEGINHKAIPVPEIGVTHNAKGQATALIVGPDDKVSERILVTSRIMGNDWVVESGLQPGDRVIVHGLQMVRPGMKVKAVAAPASLASAPASDSGAGTSPDAAAP